jgi:hypothetical protein
LVQLTDLKGEWAAAIGKAFVAFGSIEHVTVVCLRELPRDRIQRTTRSFRLGQRISLLVELLEGYDGDLYKELSAKLQRAKDLAETRNIIAHNPLVMDFFRRQDGSMFTREVIAHLHQDKHITLEQLQQFASESEALASELYRCSSAVFQAHRQPAGA